ncbi:MAG: ABC transporter ATP-binding protein [Clostridium sp.]
MLNGNIILSLENITKTYANGKIQTKALKGINMELREGEMVAIMGSSGSGKSTLLNIIGALDSPTDGKLYIENKFIQNYHIEPYATEYRSEKIGFIFQNYNLLKDLTVEDNIVLPLLLNGVSRKEREQKVERIIELLGLNGLEKNRPIELSGGQQQRVAIGRALIINPIVLLADEPTGNLDYNTSLEILKVIKDMQKKFNQSIILVTHDPNVSTHVDRVLFMRDGEIVDKYINEPGKENIKQILKKFINLEKRDD